MNVALTRTRYAVIILTVITALIHLFLGIADLTSGAASFGLIFVLNGLGYLALLAALYFVPQLAGMRSTIRWVLLGFTAVTFVLYFVFNWPNVWGPVGLFDKIVELLLIIALWMDRGS